MSEDYEFDVWVDGEYYASVSCGNRADAIREVLHYIAGAADHEVYEVTRRKMAIGEYAP